MTIRKSLLSLLLLPSLSFGMNTGGDEITKNNDAQNSFICEQPPLNFSQPPIDFYVGNN